MLLHEWQSQWKQALLTPADDDEQACAPSLPSLSGSGLALYRELLHATVESALQSIYPYTARWLSQEHCLETHGLASWPVWVERYRRAYPNSSPLLLEAVSAFPEFLAQQPALMRQYPFLSDLARYEWTEVQVANWANWPTEVALVPERLNAPERRERTTMPMSGNWAEIPPPEAWRQARPIWNPARCLLSLAYPIPDLLTRWNQDAWQDAGQDEWGQAHPEAVAMQPTSVLLYRDVVTLKVRFFNVSPLVAALLTLSETNEQASYHDLLQYLVRQMPMLQAFRAEELQQQAQALFAQCLENGMLLGSTLNAHSPQEQDAPVTLSIEPH